jgi:hypothetical protein
MNPPDSEALDDTTAATAAPGSEHPGNNETLAAEQRDYLEGLLDDASSAPTPKNISVISDKITTFLTTTGHA